MDLFLNEKPVKALVTIRRSRDDIYGSVISREIDTTYAHAVKIISKLEDRGLVESRKEGRKKILHLTEEGETYADLFMELLENSKEESNLEPIGEESTEKFQLT